MVQQPNQYVYILYNKYCPFVYKIGYTTRTPEDRARELSKETGTPGNWEVGHKWCVENGYWLEQRIFAKFKSYRISRRNEHFEFKGYSVKQVAKMISEFININGISPKEEARKAEEKRQIERQKLEREKELERQRLWQEQQLEARNSECKRLINEIKLLVNKRIKQETPLFASKSTRQRIQNKYLKYLNLPFDLNKLRLLKKELTVIQNTEVSHAPILNNNSSSASNNENNKDVFFWVVISVGFSIFMIVTATNNNNKEQTSTPIQEEIQISQDEQQPHTLPNQNAEQPVASIPETTQSANQQQNQRNEQQFAEKTHFDTIFKAHPDAERVIKSSQFNNWLSSQSLNQQNYYNYVLDHGTATQVISLFNQYKADIHSIQNNVQAITMPTTQPVDMSPQTIYEKYQKPLISSENKPLEVQSAESMPDLSN